MYRRRTTIERCPVCWVITRSSTPAVRVGGGIRPPGVGVYGGTTLFLRGRLARRALLAGRLAALGLLRPAFAPGSLVRHCASLRALADFTMGLAYYRHAQRVHPYVW